MQSLLGFEVAILGADRKEYARKYRAEGYGRNADKRYRDSHKAERAAYMKEYMRKRRDAQRPARA